LLRSGATFGHPLAGFHGVRRPLDAHSQLRGAGGWSRAKLREPSPRRLRLPRVFARHVSGLGSGSGRGYPNRSRRWSKTLGCRGFLVRQGLRVSDSSATIPATRPEAWAMVAGFGPKRAGWVGAGPETAGAWRSVRPRSLQRRALKPCLLVANVSRRRPARRLRNRGRVAAGRVYEPFRGPGRR
jgi:hypothetical protein